MGCCGGARRAAVSAYVRSVAPIVRNTEIPRFIAPPTVRESDGLCVYCKTPIAEKVKRDHRGNWSKVPWCPRCRLETA